MLWLPQYSEGASGERNGCSVRHNLKNMLYLFFPQTERAYQKQPTIFQNKKRVLTTDGGKEVKEKLPRYHKSVGLGFKTPREVTSIKHSKKRSIL